MNAQDFVSRIEWLEKNVLGDSDSSKFINGVLLALDDYRAAQQGVQPTVLCDCPPPVSYENFVCLRCGLPVTHSG